MTSTVLTQKGEPMRQRTLDEMVSYCNRQVSEMDIDQSYKIQLLGMVSAIAYGVQKPQWIPCSECINYIDERCVVANHHVSEKENCMEVFGAKRRTVERRRAWNHLMKTTAMSVKVTAMTTT